MTFEENVTKAGGHVHWRSTPPRPSASSSNSSRRPGLQDVVKIKTMTSAEIDLNSALESRRHHRLRDRSRRTHRPTRRRPTKPHRGSRHPPQPATRSRTIFLEHMGEWGLKAPDDLTNVPSDLAKAARLHLRERFLASRVGISGANFLVAETGSVAIVESEGNGRMCLTLPHTLISVAGIDKVIPRFEDLDVFFQVLPRSATGERMNPYNSIWTGVTSDDGPQDFHVVLIDNGRSNALSDRVGREALRCIRCAACLNVCPVYERVGGHAYGSVYPGPIGAILTPQLNHVTSDHVAKSLPYASTLCGACFDACPVRIDIPKLLVHLRGEVVNAGRSTVPTTQEQAAMRAASMDLWKLVAPARHHWRSVQSPRDWSARGTSHCPGGSRGGAVFEACPCRSPIPSRPGGAANEVAPRRLSRRSFETVDFAAPSTSAVSPTPRESAKSLRARTPTKRPLAMRSSRR